MAITAMGIGTKQAPENVNLDPQRQFWSWLSAFIHPDEKSADSYHHQRGYFHGFACTQTDPAGMSIQIGGTGSVDSALLAIGRGRCVLLSTDGEPEVVAIPTAPASGSRIDAVVSYIDTTSADPEGETPGTPEYVKTIVVSGTASSSPSAPTDAQIVSALPAGAGGTYYRWCDVRVAQGATTITNSNITDRKPKSPNVYLTTSTLNVPVPLKSDGDLIAQRMGNLVTVYTSSHFAISKDISTQVSIGNVLPVGYRPAVSLEAPLGARGGHTGRAAIYLGGRIDLYLSTNPGVNTPLYFNATYLTNDPMPS